MKSFTHKKMRSINFPFPYEDGSRAVMAGIYVLEKVRNFVKTKINIVELDPHSRICNIALISSKWPFLYSEMAILECGKKLKYNWLIKDYIVRL